jgi:branched-chain amino acid transport system substrate-binding protein
LVTRKKGFERASLGDVRNGYNKSNLNSWREKMKKLCWLNVILIYGLVSGICAQGAFAASPNPEARTLKIGILSNLTGPISTAAIPHTRATQMAADWINGKGGINIKGQRYLVELIVEDLKETADTAITAATKLVELHKVKYIIGSISPVQTAAVGSITEPAGVLRTIWHGEGAPMEISAKTPYSFRVPVIPRDFAPQLLKYQLKAYPDAKKITMVFIDNPAAPTLFEKTKKMAEALGLQVLGLDVYPVATRDFYPLLSKVLATKPDAIYGDGLPHLMGGILKSARELGFTNPIFNLAPTSPEVVRNIAGKGFATECIVPAPEVASPEMTPMIKEIRKMLLDKYKECNFDYVRAWDSIWWLVQAMEKAQSIDPAPVAKTLERMDQIQSTTGMGKMGGQQSYGINHIGVLPFAVTRMVKGELQHAGWFTPDIP